MREDFLSIRKGDEIEALLTPIGASVRSLYVRDRKGARRDVVLGYETAEEYRSNPASLGAVVGRYAGRIGGASFSLGGRAYALDRNEGENCLHSGFNRYETREFSLLEKTDSMALFELPSADGDQGFPGEARIRVRYEVESGPALRVSYEATTDRETVFNLTNHSYFNLNGHASGSVRDHELLVRADTFIVLDEAGIPTGEIRPVDGTPLDLREAGRLDSAYDNALILQERPGDRPIASLRSEESGIQMDVYTDRPVVILYTAEYLSVESAKEGAGYQKGHAVCLETEAFPDAMNQCSFPLEVFDPQRPFLSSTRFCFSAEY